MKYSKQEMIDFLSELNKESIRLSINTEVVAPQYLTQHLEMLNEIKQVIELYYPRKGE